MAKFIIESKLIPVLSLTVLTLIVPIIQTQGQGSSTSGLAYEGKIKAYAPNSETPNVIDFHTGFTVTTRSRRDTEPQKSTRTEVSKVSGLVTSTTLVGINKDMKEVFNIKGTFVNHYSVQADYPEYQNNEIPESTRKEHSEPPKFLFTGQISVKLGDHVVSVTNVDSALGVVELQNRLKRELDSGPNVDIVFTIEGKVVPDKPHRLNPSLLIKYELAFTPAEPGTESKDFLAKNIAKRRELIDGTIYNIEGSNKGAVVALQLAFVEEEYKTYYDDESSAYALDENDPAFSGVGTPGPNTSQLKIGFNGLLKSYDGSTAFEIGLDTHLTKENDEYYRDVRSAGAPGVGFTAQGELVIDAGEDEPSHADVTFDIGVSQGKE